MVCIHTHYIRQYIAHIYTAFVHLPEPEPRFLATTLLSFQIWGQHLDEAIPDLTDPKLCKQNFTDYIKELLVLDIIYR